MYCPDVISDVLTMYLNAYPKVTFVQLRSFEAVARLGGITRAAAALHLTQPTVSTQLKELRSAVGVDLLVPAGRGVRITDAGRDLLATIEAMFESWREFESGILDRQQMIRGSLKIAGVTTTEYFLAQWLKPFVDAFPGIDVDLVIENRDKVVNRLENAQDDLAVMMMPPLHIPLSATPVMENPLCLVGPLAHPWSDRRAIPLKKLADEPLLMREPGSGTRQAALEFLAEHELTPNIRMTLGSNEAIKHAVAAGLGLAVVSRHAIAPDPAADNLAILKVAGFPISRHWHVVHRADRRLPRPAAVFLQYLEQAVSISTA